MISKSVAQSILTACHAKGDYHALPSDSVDRLLQEADLLKYHKPKDANGSRARCFHAYLVRRAGSDA